MVLPCLLALLALPTPALALAAFLASLLPAALLGTSLGQQVGGFLDGFLCQSQRNICCLFFVKTFYCIDAGRPPPPSNRLAVH